MPTIRIYSDYRFNEYLSIRKNVFVLEQNIPSQLEGDEFDDLSRSDVIHFAYWHKRVLIAVARVILMSKDEARIGRIATVKEMRNLGYASQLLYDIEVYMHNTGYNKLTIHSQMDSLGFYLRNNYQKQGEPFLEANILHQRVFKLI